jgi:hypothetical protein
MGLLNVIIALVGVAYTSVSLFQVSENKNCRTVQLGCLSNLGNKSDPKATPLILSLFVCSSQLAFRLLLVAMVRVIPVPVQVALVVLWPPALCRASASLSPTKS